MSAAAPGRGARRARAVRRLALVAALATACVAGRPARGRAQLPPAPVPPSTVPAGEPPPPPSDTLTVVSPAHATDADLRAAWRFEIVDVGDSTFRFGVAGVRWVHAGARGILVDPRRRDALVGRFAVEHVAGDTATALVVGQTQRVVAEHVALLVAPPVKPWRQRAFWQGSVTGALTAGVLTALAFLVAR